MRKEEGGRGKEEGKVAAVSARSFLLPPSSFLLQ